MKPMKFVLLASLVALNAVALAQGTTEEEFNYLTKGYAIQLSSGLDMKKGYTLTDMGKWPLDYGNSVQRTTSFKGLYREGSTKPCAILMIYKKPDGTPAYYCIPSLDADGELWARTFRSINAVTTEIGSGEMDAAIIYGLMHLGMQEATK